MPRESVLLLSDDADFVRAAQRLDVDVTVVIGSDQKDWGEVEPSGARHIFIEDRPSNVEGVLLSLYRAGIPAAAVSGPVFDAVYASDELAVVAATVLAEALGARSRSLSPDVAVRFRDKSLQKAALRAAGIDTARCEVIEDLSELPEDFAAPFLPAVLKPVAGGAAEQTSVINSAEDLQAAAARTREQHWSGRRMRTFLLEEFMPGDEWHVDGVVFDGELRFVSVGGYRQSCLTTVSSHQALNTYLFDPGDDAAVYQRVTPLAEQCLRVLGLRSGVFHMELFHDPRTGRLVFGECAARRGGGLIEEEVQHKFGVSLAEAAVQCALGIEPIIKPEVRPGALGTTYLPYVPGTLLAHPSVDELQELPDVLFATIELPLGYVMRPGSDTKLKIGQVMIAADDRDALFRRSAQIVDWFSSLAVVLPPDPAPAQLRAFQRSLAEQGCAPQPRPVAAGSLPT